MTLARSRAEIHTWGTIIFIDASSSVIDKAAIDLSINKVRAFLYFVDEIFSTYKDQSEVSRLRRGEISIEGCCADLQEVWALCLVAKELTDGSFDPWCVEGGFDPSGYVKGWASDRAISMLKADGVEHIQINSAGDLSLAGGVEPGKPWSIGIRHPEDAHTIVKVFDITDGAIATSGTYERGSHIKDPHTGLIAIGARSATVYGPDGGVADALATALIVAGKDGAYLFQKPELSGYHCWVIERHSDEAWAI
jgi:thiamine biosynthesis lipoprotein